MDFLSQKKDLLLTYTAVFLLFFIRFVYYGFEYYPQLDDYIQYYSYRQFLGTVPEIIEKLGLFSARPIAGFMDITVWNFFFSKNMIFGVMILSLMYTASAFLLKKSFSNIFTVGNLFIVLYTLLPLGFEGTYWVSASSRVVVGMFFASLSIYFFSEYCQGGKVYNIPLFMIFQLITFGFYEQAIVFSITITFLFVIYEFFNKNKRGFFGFLTFVNVGVFVAFTSYFKTSSLYSQRMEIMLPNKEGYFDVFLPDIMGQFKEVFINGNFYTIYKGFLRGANIIFLDKGFLYLIFIILLCAFLYTMENDIEINKPIIAIVFGVLLFIAPLTPFLVLGNPWFSFRGAVPSFAGFSLVLDTIFNLCIRNTKVRGIVISFVIFIFSVSAVSEIHDYRENSVKDKEIAMAYIDATKDMDDNFRVGIFNVNEFNVKNQNYKYHEHIASVTAGEWSFLGACRYFLKDFNIPTPVPLSTNEYVHRPYNSSERNLESFDRLLWYDGERMKEVKATKIGDDDYIIEGEKVYGTVYNYGGYGVFRWE